RTWLISLPRRGACRPRRRRGGWSRPRLPGNVETGAIVVLAIRGRFAAPADFAWRTNSTSDRCSAARSATSRTGGFLVQAARDPDAHLPRHQPSAAFRDGLFLAARSLPTPGPAAASPRGPAY